MLSPVHNRKVSSQTRSQLLKILQNAGLTWVRVKDLNEAKKTFIEIETRVQGRLAGPIEEYILLYILARDVGRRFKGKDCQIVEIGTLFGGSSILIWHALKRENASIRIVTIDPLDGYYKDKKTGSGSDFDIVLNLKITEKLVHENFASFSIPKEDIRIVKDLSQNQPPILAASERPVGLLFIDGDHSLLGIQKDIENYIDFVHPEGHLAIDNFLDVDWPQVTEGILTNLDLVKNFCPILSHSKLLVLNQSNSGFFESPISKHFLSETGDFLNLFRQRTSHLRMLLSNDLDKIVQENNETLNKNIADILETQLLPEVPKFGTSNNTALQMAPMLLTFANVLKEKGRLIEQLEEQNEHLKSSIEQEQSNYSNLLIKNDALCDSLDQVDKGLERFSSKLWEQEKELETSSATISKQQAEIELSQSTISRQAKKLSQSQDTILKHNEELGKSQAIIQKQEGEIKELRTTRTGLKQQIRSQSRRLDKNHLKIHDLEKQLAETERLKEESDQKNKALENNKKDLEIQIKSLTEDIANYADRIRNLEHTCGQQQQEGERLKSDLGNTSKELQNLSQEYESFKASQAQLVAELKQNLESKSTKIRVLEEEKGRLVFELKTYIGELRNREEELKLFKGF
ncbi:MAG: hypothetical protein CMI15_11870 [Opitutaceae bacterium]|nr:hypothetical protein [Opitutaceae bacterium]